MILQVEGFSAGYGASTIVREATFGVPEGALTVIIGPNGAGKSTLLKAIFGLADRKGGRVVADFEPRPSDLARLSPLAISRLGLGMVPQTDDVFPQMTVRENLLVGGTTARRDRRQRLDELYTLMPLLRERERQRAGSLSGGQRKTIAVARALMTRPRVLLLDEPTAGMAPLVVEELFSLMRVLTETGTTILMVEQNARRALAAADWAIVLDTGAVRFEGAGGDLLADGRVADLYLGAMAGPPAEPD